MAQTGTNAGNTGLRIHATDANIFRYTESLRIGKRIDLGPGHLQPHLRASIERQDSDGGTLRINDGTFTPTMDGLRGHAEVGITWMPTIRTQLHFSYAYT